ncbi:DUF6291 domain-containing protein [Bacteroides thetaiotaomicron]|jgi:hypothetical protein|uniref:DUF6291 domain-containing protein n=1 Tax=Bacteroides thetaiotaomicron TaxID=818 RepID=UPI001CE3823A|nr:DUF6291 domain-containing protein [Bacteroides thetaiotaomicron]MCA6051667.1 hypothetical protein [Bacteroides thetaiotaomicron]
MNRKSFVIHCDIEDQLDLLTNEQVGTLFRSVVRYASNEEEISSNDGMVKLLFSVIKKQIDRDTEKYKAVCERRREAGSKGGKQKVANAKQKVANVANASKCEQNLANVADSDNDSDSVSTEVDIKENTIVLKKDKLSLSPPSEEFIKFNQWLDDHCPFVLKVKTQMTEPEYQKLLAKYTKKEISDVLESLNNWKDFPKKRTNVYRSTLDELKKKFGER